MFSFRDKMCFVFVGDVPPPGTYDPKFGTKVKGIGMAKMTDRFTEPKPVPADSNLQRSASLNALPVFRTVSNKSKSSKEFKAYQWYFSCHVKCNVYQFLSLQPQMPKKSMKKTTPSSTKVKYDIPGGDKVRKNIECDFSSSEDLTPLKENRTQLLALQDQLAQTCQKLEDTEAKCQQLENEISVDKKVH